LTPKKDPIIIHPDPAEDAQVDDIKSERWAASNRNQWAASRWNAWADKSESALCGFHEARDVRVEPPLGVFDSARVRAWLEAMDRRFAGVDSWIP